MKEKRSSQDNLVGGGGGERLRVDVMMEADVALAFMRPQSGRGVPVVSRSSVILVPGRPPITMVEFRSRSMRDFWSYL